MKYKLSVLVPGIRSHRWRELYDSIKISFSGSWEMVVIGPFEPSQDLMDEGNVKYIKDFGSPIRCQQMGLIQSEGEWITWAADDGQFFQSSLDIAFKHLEEEKDGGRRDPATPLYKNLVMGKYYEGYTGEVDQTKGALRHMADDFYYILNNHAGHDFPNMPAKSYMLNVGIVSKQLLEEVGGWDCQFEVCPLSYNDLAVRLKKFKVNFIIQNEMMYHCTHMPVRTGDHGPIHDAQITHDTPLFASIYSDPAQANRIYVDLDNWKNSPDHWTRRFGSKEEKTVESYDELPFNTTNDAW